MEKGWVTLWLHTRGLGSRRMGQGDVLIRYDAPMEATISAPEGNLESDYASLPEDFFARVAPTPVVAPRLLRWNAALGAELGFSEGWATDPDGLATLAGNRRLGEAEPIAMAYAGHQFGNWVPSLGDGRAIQIGETSDAKGNRWGIQLKGAGPTPFSRRGDGRAAIGPVLREYVLSEAMHAMGIPTTRALAMVTTGEPVYRERTEPGAILTRVARGFVRVGTFEYFAARRNTDSLRALADYVIAHRYPEAAEESNPYRGLLERVLSCQAELISRWMLVGFIHGVMNTDNMSIFGETIDYGPCAFLDEYDPGKVFSSIDQNGRYAYHQQPGIGLWNLTRFAETLVPLLDDEQEKAVEIANEVLETYASRFQTGYYAGLCRKLGFAESNERNRELAGELLEIMSKQGADFTLSFRRLSEVGMNEMAAEARLRSLFAEPSAFDAWANLYRDRLREEGAEEGTRLAAMRRVNPRFIPRNHRVQEAIAAMVEREDEGPLEALLHVTSRPFATDDELGAVSDDPGSSKYVEYENPPQPNEVVHQTFCGT